MLISRKSNNLDNLCSEFLPSLAKVYLEGYGMCVCGRKGGGVYIGSYCVET